MKSALDKLLYKNVAEFNEQLHTLNEQEKTLSDDLKNTIKILMVLAKDATEDQLELLTKIKDNLKIHRVLLDSIAALFDYLPYPDLERFAKQLQKDSLQLRTYLEAYDKDPLSGRAPILNKRGTASKSTEQIFAEQFDTSSLSDLLANVQNLADGSFLTAQQQFSLAQQVIYINAVGKEFPLTIKRSSTTNLTGLSREMLKNLSQVLTAKSNDPIEGKQGRIKAQLNLIAVMREQYFRSTGVFLNATQILSVVLSLNDLHHNGFVELPADEAQYDTKAFLAAMQWSLNYQTGELLAKQFKYKATKDFFASIGIPAEIIETNITEEKLNTGIVKPELAGLSKATDIQLAYRMPANGTNQFKDVSEPLNYSQEFLQRVSIALNMAEQGQPVLLIAQDARHVAELKEQLATYLKSENVEVKLDAFTDAESKEKRHVWFKENKLKQLKIAITTTELATNKEFNTTHSAGCLAIQTYMNEPGETKQLITNLMSFGKKNHFVALYEEHGIISVLSRSLASKKDKELILESISVNKTNRNQERAVEQYYLQAVTSIQRVALRQLDQWQAFLHLIYPRSEWTLLDKKLLSMRQNFIKKMELSWNQLLLATDPKQLYPNPYIRRDSQNKLDTLTLDKAVRTYELNTDALWNNVRSELKDMELPGKIPPHSVNGLRRKHLENINFQEELVLDRLAIRDSKKVLLRERKKAIRLVESALDVNGAMLKYTEGNLASYKQPFLDRQFKLISLDICKQINLSSLSSKTKKILVERALHAENLLSLELVLIDYESLWPRPGRNSEKYRMQPIINELLRIHQFAGVEASEQLLVLKNIYLDNAANDIVDDLEQALSWARKENRGFGYFLERSAVQHAACDILNAVDDVKYASDPAMKKQALKTLYSTLTQHQAQLEGLWIFSFGHQNTRELINRSLYVLNDLTVIGSGKDELTADFINECKEEAQSNLAKQKFNDVIRELEQRNNPWLKNSKEWQDVVAGLEDIARDNPTLYAIDEMHHFISVQCDELLHASRSKLREPFIHLRGSLRSLWLDATHQHQELLNESRHFELKKEQIRKNLETILAYNVNHVELLTGSNGSNDYFDLVINGKGSLPLLDKFTHYHSHVNKMREELELLRAQLTLLTKRQNNLSQLINNQLPLISSSKGEKDFVNLFPHDLQQTVTEIISLQNFVVDSIDNVPQDILNALTDRAVLRSLDRDLFFNKESVGSSEAKQMLEQIETITDAHLKSDLKRLYDKIHPPVVEQSAPSWWSPKNWIPNISAGIGNAAAHVIGAFIPTDTEEDWRYQFAELIGRPDCSLVSYFKQLINKKMAFLTVELTSRENIEADAVVSLNSQLQFIEAAIKEEQTKSVSLFHRFSSLGELYEFERNLREYAANTAAMAPDAADKPSMYDEYNDEDEQFIHSEEPVGFENEAISDEEYAGFGLKYN